MNQSPEIDQVAAALVAAQAEFEAVDRTAENPFFRSTYADLPAIVKASQPILAAHGLAVVQFPDHDGERDLLTTIILHTSGQWLGASMVLHPSKSDPQAQGSAITYARRYARSAALGIVTEEDDDGNAASRSHRRPPAGGQEAGAEPGVCPACGGGRVRILPSGKEIPCPVCAEAER